jgi:tRNA-dihydrouridine synthase B
MVHSQVAQYNHLKTRTRLEFHPLEDIRVVQILGNDPAAMAEAAQFQVALGADIIDINMGCPAKKVCRKAAGSALLADPAQVSRILKAVVAASNVPVTLKIRTGVCPDQKNAIEIARIAESEGIQALTIHGRTRACRFKGLAEYDTIASVRDMTSLPLVANGDIDSCEAARHVLGKTGADALMIGRAARGRPWIFREIQQALSFDRNVARVSTREKIDCINRHLDGIYALYGEPQGVRMARKHLGWYLSDTNEGRILHKAFNHLATAQEQKRFIKQHLRTEVLFQGDSTHER